MRSYVRTLLILVVGMMLGIGLSATRSVWASHNTTPTMPWRQVNLFAEVFERVHRDYVEDISDEQLMSAAVRGLVSSLDPYSTYLDAKEYEEMRISTSGVYSGVGIELSMDDGILKVMSAIDDSPAARAGIKSGDTILSVDNIPADAEHINDAVERMRGKPGAHVKLAVSRAEAPQPLQFDLIRREVQMHSVKSQVLDSGYGYLRIAQFTETTSDDVLAAMRELQTKTKGLRGLVLDLRNNPGGVLEASVDVADDFLDHGIIVTADGRSADARFAMNAKPGDLLNGAPLTVLVNGGSASASEIVAGALQDNKRATLIGATTFGKGLVQTVVALEQGGALKLTTSRYYTPSGASINQRGITPDVILGNPNKVAANAPSSTAAEGNLLDDAEVRVALDKLKQINVAVKSPRGAAEKVNEKT